MDQFELDLLLFWLFWIRFPITIHLVIERILLEICSSTSSPHYIPNAQVCFLYGGKQAHHDGLGNVYFRVAESSIRTDRQSYN
jgi:hypothetical protein